MHKTGGKRCQLVFVRPNDLEKGNLRTLREVSPDNVQLVLHIHDLSLSLCSLLSLMWWVLIAIIQSKELAGGNHRQTDRQTVQTCPSRGDGGGLPTTSASTSQQLLTTALIITYCPTAKRSCERICSRLPFDLPKSY